MGQIKDAIFDSPNKIQRNITAAAHPQVNDPFDIF